MDENKAQKTFLDLMPLPNGYYAVPCEGVKDGFVYLSIRTLYKPMKEDRRYRYGKIVTGAESDSGRYPSRYRAGLRTRRSCVGMQRPGQGYDGQYTSKASSRSWSRRRLTLSCSPRSQALLHLREGPHRP